MNKYVKRGVRWCQKHPFLSLAAVALIPQGFLFLMGMLCKLLPQMLAASFAYLVLYLLLWAAGILLWAGALVSKRKRKAKGEGR